jgi:hypothetical protein
LIAIARRGRERIWSPEKEEKAEAVAVLDARESGENGEAEWPTLAAPVLLLKPGRGAVTM